MTIHKKIAWVAVLIVAIGAALFEAIQARDARNDAQMFRRQQAMLVDQIGNLRASLADLTNRLENLRAENSRLRGNSDRDELLKLRGEVTRLRPLQDDVVALQKMLKQSSAGLAEWKTNELANMGRANPMDALQTYIYSATHLNSPEVQNSIIGNPADPPSPEALSSFVANPNNHPTSGDGVKGFRVLSQSWLAPDEVQLELDVSFGDTGMGVSMPITLRNMDGEWKVVVFNVRNSDGTVNHLGYSDESSVR